MSDQFPIYFEQQSGSLCGRHAINSLLQGPFITEVDLSEIARELDDAERALMLSAGADTADALRYLGEESFNVDDSGNFSVTVLREAVRRSHGISFDSDPAAVSSALEDAQRYEGFLFNLEQHWFVIRKLRTPSGPRWFNLNSLQRSPTALGDFYVSAFLAEMKAEGYSIFVVTPGPLGHLPHPVDTSQGSPACWLRAADVLAHGGSAADVRRSAAERARQTAHGDPEFEAALAASLADADAGGGGAGSGAAHKRLRRSGGAADEDGELQEALRQSLLAATGASAPAVAGAPVSLVRSVSAEDAEALAQALAMSLEGGGGAAAVPSEQGVIDEMRRLRSALGVEPPAGGGTARLQVRVPASLPLPMSGAGAAAASGRPLHCQVQRRFAADAPVAGVLDWAALAWLEAAYPHLAVPSGAGTGSAEPAAGTSVVPPFSLLASLQPPVVLRSDSDADRALTVGGAGLLPSAMLTLRAS